MASHPLAPCPPRPTLALERLQDAVTNAAALKRMGVRTEDVRAVLDWALWLDNHAALARLGRPRVLGRGQ